jgi:hypothetical protein
VTTHKIHKRQISTPPAGFEHAIPETERPQTHAARPTGSAKYFYKICNCKILFPVTIERFLNSVRMESKSTPCQKIVNSHGRFSVRSYVRMANSGIERECDDSLVAELAGCSKFRGARAVLFPAGGSAPAGVLARRPPLTLVMQ